MRITEDIRSLSDFLRNTREHVERLRRTRRPEVLTRNGHPALVVQSAESYQELLDRLEELETLAALDQATAEIERGEGSPVGETVERLRKRGSKSSGQRRLGVAEGGPDREDDRERLLERHGTRG